MDLLSRYWATPQLERQVVLIVKAGGQRLFEFLFGNCVCRVDNERCFFLGD